MSCEFEYAIAYVCFALNNGSVFFFLNYELRMRRRIYNLIFFLFFTILIVFLALIKLNSDSFFSECSVETSMQKLHNVGMIAVR